MAILKPKKNKAEKAPVEKSESKKDVMPFAGKVALIKPRITEKASLKSETENVYVFEVVKDSNKKSISKAVAELYKVTPVKVNITKNPSKAVFVRGKWGTKSGVKKAYVYLKKGDKMEI